VLPAAVLAVQQEAELGPDGYHRSLMIDGSPAQVDSLLPRALQVRIVCDLLDVSVLLDASSPAQLSALIGDVSVHPAATLQVPTGTGSMTLTLSRPAGYTGVAPPRATTRVTSRIAAVLQALRTAPLLPLASTATCTSAQTVIVTPLGGRTYTVSLGSCDQVVAGNGPLARATPALLSALIAITGPGRV
jgi:hypothetical protein